jgi:cytochrome c556
LVVGLVVSVLIVGGALGLSAGNAQVPNPPKASGWLKKLPSDQQVDAIDRQLRGFDAAMIEVNYRYIEMYFGAIEGNWDYALYTGEKIAWAIQNGFERRQKRRANAEQIFLKQVYPEVLDAIRKKDITLFKRRFDTLRHACNACHVAESVPFIQIGIPTFRHAPLVNN